MQSVEEIAAINDPGEVGKEHHNRGDRFTIFVANIFAWIFPLLMIAICSQVVLRSAGMNQAWLDDFQWWLYGSAVLVGIGYAVTTNSHVRVDILYDNFPERKKNRTEVFALVWLFLPFIILCWDVTLHYAITSVAANEGSSSPNGLHNLWMLKVFMNASFVLIGIAIWSAYLRNLAKMMKPTMSRQLIYAFPSTMFLVNLAVYYIVWGYTFLTSPAGTTNRDVSRSPIFDEFELGSYDIKYTIVITLVATILVIGIARLLDRGARNETEV